MRGAPRRPPRARGRGNWVPGAAARRDGGGGAAVGGVGWGTRAGERVRATMGEGSMRAARVA
eukprot:4012567-Prymnesium_polylepis.1